MILTVFTRAAEQMAHSFVAALLALAIWKRFGGGKR